ncbi:DUF6385 domain-containing protein [Microaerobacter geothermalis]|uniref:DUF6385 domain-containing protein n=1 Tax=Microaerobacter geothermalis TaxID=674972 RepID=UPI001F4810B5|nr:DUF6385 domain-containing protein [Microaerobacter geothermalis]MCF6093311.1 DUF6385 domain-containing protein [Microaerobacter geothermalis]
MNKHLPKLFHVAQDIQQVVKTIYINQNRPSHARVRTIENDHFLSRHSTMKQSKIKKVSVKGSAIKKMKVKESKINHLTVEDFFADKISADKIKGEKLYVEKLEISKNDPLNIRPLESYKDSLLIYGRTKDGELKPVKVDEEGKLYVTGEFSITISPVEYLEEAYPDLTADCVIKSIPFLDMSLTQVGSFAVINHGPSTVVAQVEISPDKISYQTDTPSEEIEAGRMKVLVAPTFLKYARISYKTTLPGTLSKITIYFQGQGAKVV